MSGISQTMTTSFKVELLDGVHAFGSIYRSADTFKIALLKSIVSGTYGATTINYSQVVANGDEVVAVGYTVGGGTLVVNPTPTAGNTGAATAYVSFNNYTWNSAISSSGALIYNSTQDGRSVALLSFGKIITSNLTFEVQFPTAAAGTAIIQIQ